MEQVMADKDADVTVTMNNGDTYIFNTRDNEEMIIEAIGTHCVLCIEGGEGKPYGTAWLATSEISSIQI